MRRLFLHTTCLSFVLASGALAQSEVQRAREAVSLTSPAAAPSLVVFLTVDQLRPDYLSTYESQLQGGLARLWKGGAVFVNGFQDHGITETAPGHASTLSGRFPRGTGIVANDAGVLDPGTTLLGASGDGASPFRFRGTTLTDWLQQRNPATRALSVSRKDRGAILPMGRGKRDVYWYASNGTFTTSTYYADTLPAWVNEFNARKIPHSYAGQSWTLLLPENAYAERDTVPAESGGHAFVFPHQFPADTTQTTAAFAGFPMMDELTLRFALDGLRALDLGSSDRTDVLAISLSSTDAVGHRFGPDSRELHDQILRLDRALGVFFDSLYAIRDSSRIVVALTADHGVAPLAQLPSSRYRSDSAGTVDVLPVLRTAYASMLAGGVDSSAVIWDNGVLYLDPRGFQRSKLNRDSVARAIARAVSAVPNVLRADAVIDLARRDTVRDDIARRWLHMFPADVPAAVVVTLAPYWYWDGVTYATHGSPHDYDARVPIIFYGASIRPGRSNDRVRVVDIAPTLAHLLDARPTEPLDGHVLRSALVP
jgi:predicted AlkP superfamily pyrophosphatase or phosphodiesterase